MPSEGTHRNRLVIRAALVASAAMLSTLLVRVAHAEPQATAGLTIGAAGVGVDRTIWDRTVLHLGLRGDVLFGRDDTHDFGVGPYLEVLTHGFEEAQFGGGLSTLFPITESLPLVLSVGGYGRLAWTGIEPGITGQLFWGSRSYNFHANYVMAAGILAEMRYGLGASRETAILVGAQLDLAAMSLPFVLLINAVRGGSSETASVE